MGFPPDTRKKTCVHVPASRLRSRARVYVVASRETKPPLGSIHRDGFRDSVVIERFCDRCALRWASAKIRAMPVKHTKERTGEEYARGRRPSFLLTSATCGAASTAQDVKHAHYRTPSTSIRYGVRLPRPVAIPIPRQPLVVYLHVMTMTRCDPSAYFNLMEQIKTKCQATTNGMYVCIQDFHGVSTSGFVKHHARMRRFMNQNEKYYPGLLERVHQINASPRVRTCLQTVQRLMPNDVAGRNVLHVGDGGASWARR